MQGRTDKVEQWYGTEYSHQAIPKDWITAWSGVNEIMGLHLPGVNVFLPSNLDLLQVSSYVYKF